MEYGNTQFPREWVQELICYFKPMGFFSNVETSGQSFDWLIDRVNIRETFPNGPLNVVGASPAKRIEYEQDFIRSAHSSRFAFDRRVWCEDAEADFVEGDYWYIRALLSWADISQGHFRPQNLSEIWLPERPDPDSPGYPDQPIEIIFTLDKKPFRIEVDYRSGWFDYNLIRGVNEAIHLSGYQFASLWIEDQSAYVCCLKLSEVAKLKHERGWRFHDELFVM